MIDSPLPDGDEFGRTMRDLTRAADFEELGFWLGKALERSIELDEIFEQVSRCIERLKR